MPGLQGGHRARARVPGTAPIDPNEDESEPRSFRSQTTSWGRLLYIPPFYGRTGYSWNFFEQGLPTDAVYPWGRLQWMATIGAINSRALDKARLCHPRSHDHARRFISSGCRLVRTIRWFTFDPQSFLLHYRRRFLPRQPWISLWRSQPAFRTLVRGRIHSSPRLYLPSLWQLSIRKSSRPFNFFRRWRWKRCPSDVYNERKARPDEIQNFGFPSRGGGCCLGQSCASGPVPHNPWRCSASHTRCAFAGNVFLIHHLTAH